MHVLNKTRLLHTSVLSGLVMGLGGGALPVAWAQTPEAGTEAQAVPQEIIDEFEEEQDRIVVTGSRIRRADLEGIFPTTVVAPETIEKAAFTNIADALTQIPAYGGGVNPFGDQAGNIGVNFVDFLDLGPQRTLTLVNGRRFVTSDVTGGGLSVDLNVIPLALVDRIETIGVGGAPVYGADAIAGTINVTMKDDFEGLEAVALFGQTERGDSDRVSYQVVTGANSSDGKANVTFSAEYFNQEGLRQTDRPEIYINEPFTSEVPPGTSGFTDIDVDGDGEPDGVFRLFNADGSAGSYVQLFTNGGVVSRSRLFLPAQGNGGLLFEDNGNLRPYNPGRPIPGTSAFFAQGGEPYDFFSQVDQISSPLERINFGSTVRYDISSSIRFKADVQAANTKASELVDQGGFQTFAFDGTPNNDIGGALQIPVTNPYLTAQNRQALSDFGFDVNDPEEVFFFSRFNNDLLGGARRDAEVLVWRFAGGLEGEFEAFGGRKFFWDIHGVAGQSSAERDQSLLNDLRFLNALEAVRLTQADVDDISAAGNNPIGQAGDIVCQVTRDLAKIGSTDRVLGNEAYESIRGVIVGSGVTNQTIEDIDACRPLNLFGDGNSSPEAVDYVSQSGIFSTDIEQRIWSANISGDLFRLPAGWVQFAAGYETRSETAAFKTSGDIEVGLGRSAATPSTGGTYSTDEYSGELLVPIVSPKMDIPFVHFLEAEGAYRRIENSQAGPADVWTVGGTWRPVEGFTLRGNRTRSVRAPSLTELFQPIVTTFSFADDPCDERFIADEPSRAANCAAAGIMQPFTSNVVNATAQGLTGGNPNLLNETADGWTIGGIFQPEFIPGLTVTADYINIEIADLIDVRSLEQNLEACYDADDFNPGSEVCQAFTRDASGQISGFLSGQTNADDAAYEFVDIRADYAFEVADLFNMLGGDSNRDLGELSIDTIIFHAIKRDIIVDGVTLDNTIGGFG
ncbi:MAG: TonB-dependent receptor, partial [Hyphomonadaceae bacterium]|nr:TonB-dependent receptor [Hyphomonadaceae bacterium]